MNKKYCDEITKLTRENKNLRIKNHKFKEGSTIAISEVSTFSQSIMKDHIKIMKKTNNKYSNLLQNLTEKADERSKNFNLNDDLLETDPDFAALVSNVLATVRFRIEIL